MPLPDYPSLSSARWVCRWITNRVDLFWSTGRREAGKRPLCRLEGTAPSLPWRKKGGADVVTMEMVNSGSELVREDMELTPLYLLPCVRALLRGGRMTCLPSHHLKTEAGLQGKLERFLRACLPYASHQSLQLSVQLHKAVQILGKATISFAPALPVLARKPRPLWSCPRAWPCCTQLASASPVPFPICARLCLGLEPMDMTLISALLQGQAWL
jgi:hypothetical protein